MATVIARAISIGLVYYYTSSPLHPPPLFLPSRQRRVCFHDIFNARTIVSTLSNILPLLLDRKDESHNQAVERRGVLALGHAQRRRRMRHLSQSVREHMSQVQVSWRRLLSMCVSYSVLIIDCTNVCCSDRRLQSCLPHGTSSVIEAPNFSPDSSAALYILLVKTGELTGEVSHVQTE